MGSDRPRCPDCGDELLDDAHHLSSEDGRCPRSPDARLDRLEYQMREIQVSVRQQAELLKLAIEAVQKLEGVLRRGLS